MIIFGVRRKAAQLATVLALCQLCGSPAAQVLVRVRTWFTLFFVPVVPVHAAYVNRCALCGASTKVSKQQAHAVIAQAQIQNQGRTATSAPAGPGGSLPGGSAQATP